MPKIAKNSRTPLQEKMIAALLLLDATVGEGGFYHVRAVQKILGGRWTKYRQAAIDQLEDQKWVDVCTPLGSKEGNYYSVSVVGKRQIANEYKLNDRDYITSDEFDIYCGKVE